MRQLAKLDEEAKLLQEADTVVQDLEGIKGQYLEVLDTVTDREKSIHLLENQVNRLYKATETQLTKQQKKQGIKKKVKEVDQEIKDIITQLENKEHLLEVIREKEQLLASDYDSKILGPNSEGQQ